MDHLLSILVLNYYSTYIKANTDMHYTITNINMNMPTNANNHLHIGINMYISTNINTYMHILVYVSIHAVIRRTTFFFPNVGGPRSPLLRLAVPFWLELLCTAAFPIVLHLASRQLQLAGWPWAASY